MVDYLTTAGASVTAPERLYIRGVARRAAEAFNGDCLIINIGVRQGATLWCLREGAPRAEIIGIDVDRSSWPGDWTFIHADSRRYYREIDKPIHLLLIDGNHDYYGVKADILNWCPKIATGGFAVFHDYGNAEAMPWTAGVKRAVDEFMGDGWAEAGIADSIKAFLKR